MDGSDETAVLSARPLDVVLPHPLPVVVKILGLPEADPLMMTLTQQRFGGEDSDLQREELTPEAIAAILLDLFAYFSDVTEIGGHRVAKGEMVFLSHRGANLDPKVFDDPLRFDIERRCGRLTDLVRRRETLLSRRAAGTHGIAIDVQPDHPRDHLGRVAGTPTTSLTTFVGGHKTLPIRATLRN